MQGEGSEIDDETLKLLLKNMHHIIRLQAFFRGRRLRNQVKRQRKTQTLTMAPRSLMSYASNDSR